MLASTLLRPPYSPKASPFIGLFGGTVRERVRIQPIHRLATLHPLPGDNSCVAPPDPIPNSEVKRACADGSVHLACESRSSPGSYPEPRS